MTTLRRDWSLARAKVENEGRCRVKDLHCDGDLEAAHVVERSRDAERVVQPCDVVPLCTFHHARYDARRISILAELTYEEQAAAVDKLGIVRALRRLTSGQTEAVDRPVD
jgi:hypothetical protein